MKSLFIDKVWYGVHPVKWVLVPLSWIYRGISFCRRQVLQKLYQVSCPVPLIVVGNLTVGGVGKTPLVIELAKKIQAKGLRVGIVSRGYGAKVTRFPYEVQAAHLASIVGDEPLLLAQKTQCPVVIAPNRMQAVHYLLEKYQSQIIISDDGLQHYRMGRAIEIAVIDGQRGLGNGFCLPAGPLRESPKRLTEVDFIVVNEGSWEHAYPMHLRPGDVTKLATSELVNPVDLPKPIVAVAGIGNPQRFYFTLRQLGIEFTFDSYPDHYQFKPHDLNYSAPVVIMTEKDAVKCRSFISDNMYYLPVEAVLDDAFWDALWSHKQLQGFC
ncbi:MAG: tetraacyldisaccharide 4'-kinase [bacterium]|nr:tetraacyldisaccharide 4'-kinase [bacterium]